MSRVKDWKFVAQVHGLAGITTAVVAMTQEGTISYIVGATSAMYLLYSAWVYVFLVRKRGKSE